jgi:hypothetical protein
MPSDLSPPSNCPATDVPAPPPHDISPEQRLLVMEGLLVAKLRAMRMKITMVHDSVNKTGRPLSPEHSALVEGAERQFQIVASDVYLTRQLRSLTGVQDPAGFRDAYGRELLRRTLFHGLTEETGREAVLDDIENDRLLLRETCQERWTIREKEHHELEDRMKEKLVDLETKIDHINSSSSAANEPLSDDSSYVLTATTRDARYLRRELDLPARPVRGAEITNEGPGRRSGSLTVGDFTASVGGTGSWSRVSEAAKELEELFQMNSVRQALLEMKGNLRRE